MLIETWFKLISQLTVNSEIISLDLIKEIFC